MKYLRKIIYGTALTVAALSGCNKEGFQQLNINPQAATTIDVNFLLTTSQLGAASGGSQGDNRFVDWRTNIGMFSTAIQQLSSVGGISNAGNLYQHSPDINDAPFNFYYRDIRNLTEILRQTGPGGFAEGENNNTKQAARILRAFLYHRLTDYYGSIPYFEGAQAQVTQVFFPKYDKQKAIYTDLLKELDEASAAFTTGADANFAAADIYYKGNVAQWKRWGYSLMLRLAMRVSKVDLPMANTYVAKAVAGGVFQSNADNTFVPMAEGPSQWTNQNGISRAIIPGDGGEPVFLSKRLVDFLKGANVSSTADDDPRLMILSMGIGNWSATATVGITNFAPVTGGTEPVNQKGMPNGVDLTQLRTLEGNLTLDPNLTYSRINRRLLELNDPYMLMHYGEVKFLLAEAAQRGIGGLNAGQAMAHYNEGVKASMQMYTIYDASFAVTDAQVTTYLATYPYNPANGLEMIGTQLWASHFLNWWEAWSEWRRTSFPRLVEHNYPGNVTGGKIPQKLMYPNAESTSNPNFTSGASTNDYTTKVWWAGGPE
ncbi:SusD/RagB family nutrient-binding outer membrane lipoprotein [Segetibacter sp.]|uniref:SusD/RagB family nutrient-binding outer membrane lipoprotein n=1 Tax=Segetibacter sp. TaxID=2231182 RepID=UPI0026192C37|nr:SusD/RagB family nutrient-binding outer membrane lipoprotein [Segetibacter sp.]MCW3080531.1 SusD/RagB family nutrient-binding outer rane lipoprotein [Segetibacter sp.]